MIIPCSFRILFRLAFSFAAVNLAEACDKNIVPNETLIHMYLHAAIRCKLSLTPIIGSIASVSGGGLVVNVFDYKPQPHEFNSIHARHTV